MPKLTFKVNRLIPNRMSGVGYRVVMDLVLSDDDTIDTIYEMTDFQISRHGWYQNINSDSDKLYWESMIGKEIELNLTFL